MSGLNRPADQALLEYARARRSRIIPTRRLLGTDEMARSSIRFKLGSRRVEISASPSLFLIEMSISSALVFTLNHPSRGFGIGHEITELVGRVPWLVYSIDARWAEPVASWFDEPTHVSCIAQLNIRPSEEFTVYRNGLLMLGLADRDLGACIDEIISVIESVPPDMPEATPTGATLPSHLRPLARHFARYSISDDMDRSTKTARLSSRTRTMLLTTIGPLLSDINKYLDGFGDQPLNDDALALDNLAQLVAELQLGHEP